MKPANTLVTRCLTLLLISIIVSVVSLPGAANALAGPPADPADGVVVTLETPPYQLSIDANGFDVVHIDGFAPFGTPGEPTLPRKVYNVALPPDAALDSLTLEIADIQMIAVPGTYRLKPATPDIPSCSAEEDAPRYRPSSQPVPNADAADLITLSPPGQMRKWLFARLEYSPVQYDVTTGQLRLVTQVTVRISFDQSQGAQDTTLLADDVFDDVAQETFVNYETAQQWYRELGGQDQPSAVYDYVIITTNAIEAGSSSKLAAFKTHKQSQGFSVLIITQDQYGSLPGQAPNGTAEKIRKWLQINYIGYAIEYVLLIGNPDPDDPTSGGDSVGDVPMKMCWPYCTTSSSDADGCVSPTDHFYADLTGNWNLNANIYFGEWGGDYGPAGGVDLANDVTVGRIPVYNADYAGLDHILQKIIDYETEANPTSWRKTALLPMSFSTKTYDGAPLAQQMMNDYLNPGGYSHWTQYQQGSGACGLNSIYSSNQELRGDTVVRDRWAANDYGLVLWWGHGSGTEASVGCDGCWDGTLFKSSYASSLDDDHPSFVYLNSCLNGYPENTGNLQYSLLRQGAVATVGATRVSWFNDGVGYGDFDGSTTNSGIGYEYARRLVLGQAAGDALYNTKTSMTPEQKSRLMNFYDFNLYGDPSTGIQIVTASEIYLPLVLKSTSSVVNGGFEAGPTGWSQSSTHGYPLIMSKADLIVPPHSGNWAAWLGGDDNEESKISQKVIIPPGSPYLGYWHYIGSQDTCGHDEAAVAIDGTIVNRYDLCKSRVTGGWVKHVVNLSAYAGRFVWVQIAVKNDSSYNSNLFVDDVAFQATASSAVDTAATLDEGSGDPGPDVSSALPRARAGQPIE